MTSASTRDPLVGVAGFLATHSLVLTGQRIEDWRVLRVALSHPLFGSLPTGITDGVLCYCADASDVIRHVALGQCDEVRSERRAATHPAGASSPRRSSKTKILTPEQLADLV